METGVRGTNGANVCKTAVEQEGKEDHDTASIHPRNTEEGRVRVTESRHNDVPLVRANQFTSQTKRKPREGEIRAGENQARQHVSWHFFLTTNFTIFCCTK